jgi:glycosyltransferase involved in cell wall biosynthesis
MSGKPRLLLVGNHLSGAGFNPGVCEGLADRLRTRGWRVLTTSHQPRRVARVCDMLGTVWRLRHDYDVAHVDVYSGRAFFWADAVCRLLRLARKPYVVTLRGGNLVRFARRRRRRIAKLLCGASAVTTPSRFLLQHFASSEPQDRRLPDAQAIRRSGGTHLIPNPIDVSAYRYRPRRLVEPRLVWLRAFHRIYQPEAAVAAFAEIVREFPHARLTLAGPDKGDGSLARAQRLAERGGLARQIEFAGPASKASLPALLDSGDIFLNTSRVDNTPVSVLEAMAGGLCIVSTNVGGIPYLLRHECDALLTPPGCPHEMAAAVGRVLREPALAERLSQNARRSVEPYDWPAVLPLWERLFVAVAEVESL